MGVGDISVALAPIHHEVIAVGASSPEGYAEETTYRLALYEDLLTLPTPDGGSRSVFDALGRLRTDAKRQPQPILWQLGQLRLKHSDQPLPFDDPRLLEAYFKLPQMTARDVAHR